MQVTHNYKLVPLNFKKFVFIKPYILLVVRAHRTSISGKLNESANRMSGERGVCLIPPLKINEVQFN